MEALRWPWVRCLVDSGDMTEGEIDELQKLIPEERGQRMKYLWEFESVGIADLVIRNAAVCVGLSALTLALAFPDVSAPPQITGVGHVLRAWGR